MKLKKMLVVALGVFTLLSNTVTVEAKTSKFHITPREYWTKVEFYTKEVVKGCLTHTDVKTPPPPMIIIQANQTTNIFS